ncbi:type II toxin-antitoxin system VapB family antitoxin [Aureimonas sp. Leaf427]|uniref:type II toxin-antitoxin system VapB family antitoxin n=1 Tax=Aureimonas sp. Leaf427 TaxID=1736375 RepID=UPI001FCE2A86|nr:type II toxin-antitoxin system VapB family antitoxin [Aureimonas sp. Leaf427]
MKATDEDAMIAHRFAERQRGSGAMAKIDIDDALLEEAMRIFGAKTPTELVEKELRESLGYRKAQLRMLDFKGKVEWDGDLDAMRRDR